MQCCQLWLKITTFEFRSRQIEEVISTLPNHCQIARVGNTDTAAAQSLSAKMVCICKQGFAKQRKKNLEREKEKNQLEARKKAYDRIKETLSGLCYIKWGTFISLPIFFALLGHQNVTAILIILTIRTSWKHWIDQCRCTFFILYLCRLINLQLTYIFVKPFMVAFVLDINVNQPLTIKRRTFIYHVNLSMKWGIGWLIT